MCCTMFLCADWYQVWVQDCVVCSLLEVRLSVQLALELMHFLIINSGF